MAEAADNDALILQFAADNSRMLRAFEQAVAKIDKHTGDIENRTKRMGSNVEKVFELPNVGKSLDNVFRSARLNVLEEGGARLRIFGSALEPLGGLGIGAAAGIAAFGLAMERTEKAVDFAAGIAKLGKETGVSTDFIQQFNFALRQNEIDTGKGDEALKKLNASLGLVQAGLARSQQVKAFAAVGFTPEQLRQFHDVGDFFPVLVDRIVAIGNASEQAAVAKRLGIEELLPLLKQGADGFSALAQKANDLGIVMDRATIERAEEAKKKLAELDDVMKAKSNATFVQFADTLITVKEAFLAAETAALRFLAAITNTTPAEQKIRDLRNEIALLTNGPGGGLPGLLSGDKIRAKQGELNKLELGQLNAALRNADATPSAASTAARQLVPTTARKGPEDQTLAFDKSAQAAYDAGLKALIGAQAALLVDVRLRAAAEKAAVDADLTKKLHDLNAEEAKIAAARNDKGKAGQIIQIELARDEEKASAAAKKALIDRQAEERLRHQALAYDQQALEGQAELLALSERLAFSDGERQKIALQLVDLGYQRAKAELEGLIASKETAEADKKLAQLKLDQLNAQLPGQREQVRRGATEGSRSANQIVAAGANRPKSLAEQQREELAEIQRLNKERQISDEAAARASHEVNLKYFSQRLSAAAGFFGSLAGLSESNNKTVAAIGKAAAIAQATIDGIVAVQNALAYGGPPPFNFIAAATVGVAAAINVAKIAGLAEGGPVAGPGGPTDDKVLRWLSNGEYVIKANVVARTRPLLDAINAGVDPRGLLPSPTVTALPAQVPAPARGGDVHLHNNQNFAIAHEDLGRQIERNPRVLKQVILNMVRNGELKLS